MRRRGPEVPRNAGGIKALGRKDEGGSEADFAVEPWDPRVM